MSKESIAKYLSEHKFFQGLKGEDIDFLASCGTERELDRDEVLFRYDSAAKRFFVLREGRISIEVAAIEGPPLQMQQLSEGAVLGWSWLLRPYRWSFQARAEQPGVVIEFDGGTVQARCEEDPKFGYEIIKRFSALMAERLEFAREKMMEEWSPPGFA